MSLDNRFIEHNKFDILDRENYEYFKQNKRHNTQMYDDFQKWTKIVKGLILTLHELEKVSKYGIYIESIGYFCKVYIGQRKGRKISLVKRRKPFNIYLDLFIPDAKMKDYGYEFKMISRDIFKPDMDTVEFYRQLTENQSQMKTYAINRGGKNFKKYY